MTSSKDLSALYSPASIAVVGASSHPEKAGFQYLESLIRGGWEGRLFGVNPKGRSIDEVPTYQRFQEIQEPVDVAMICVPQARVEQAVGDAAEAGAAFAVINTSGFAEMSREGRQLQIRLVEIARHYGMRLIGPNTQGLMNVHQRLNLFLGDLPTPGAVSVVSQGGSIPINIMEDCDRYGLGLSKVVTFGNASDIGPAELIASLRDDDTTKVVVLHLEGLPAGYGPRFIELVREVSAVKPVVGLKGARTRAGARASASHTANLTGDDAIYRQLFEEAGIVQVDSIRELLPAAEALYRCPPMHGDRVAAIGSGGTWAILGADHLEERGLKVAPFSESVAAKIAAELPAYASGKNPVDMTGEFMRDLTLFAQMTELALAPDEDFDGSLNFGLFGFWGGENYEDDQGQHYTDAARSLGEAATTVGKPVVMYTPYGNRPHPAFDELRRVNVPCYPDLDVAAFALQTLRRRGRLLDEAKRRASGKPKVELIPDPPGDPGPAQTALSAGWVSEPDCYRLLAEYGVPIVPWAQAHDLAELSDAAEEVGYPVVLKAIARGLIHKSGVGGVEVCINSQAELLAAGERIEQRIRDRESGVVLEGFLVSRFMPGGVELLVGAVRDAVAGPVIGLGAGGVNTEVVRDIVLHTVPVTGEDVGLMLSRLRSAPGIYRKYDDEVGVHRSLGALVEGVSNLLIDHPEIVEMDINPLLVLDGRLAAVDARILVRQDGVDA